MTAAAAVGPLHLICIVHTINAATIHNTAEYLGGLVPGPLSLFFAGRVFRPALRPYMIGPMRNPDIQNLLEAFASLKRDLQCSKSRSQ